MRSEVSEQNNPPSSMVVDDVDKWSRSSNDLENVYDGIQNVETTGSDHVGEDYNAVNQDDTLTLRSIEKSDGDLVGKTTTNCKQSKKSD